MAGSVGSKGNPAGKRMMNANLKARRAKSWAAGERRKMKHEAENEAQHRANLARVKELGLVLRMVDDRRKPRHANRMTPSKALRLFDRAQAR